MPPKRHSNAPTFRNPFEHHIILDVKKTVVSLHCLLHGYLTAEASVRALSVSSQAFVVIAFPILSSFVMLLLQLPPFLLAAEFSLSHD